MNDSFPLKPKTRREFAIEYWLNRVQVLMLFGWGPVLIALLILNGNPDHVPPGLLLSGLWVLSTWTFGPWLTEDRLFGEPLPLTGAMCLEMKTLVSDYPEIRNFVQAINAMGRPVCVPDFEQATAWREWADDAPAREKSKRLREHERAACRWINGLED